MRAETQRLRRLLRRRNLIAGLPAAGAAAALLMGGGGAGAAPAAPGPSYAALHGSEPSGLALVDPGASPSQGPSWPAEVPVGAADRWPVTSSIRRLPVDLAGISAWIARSGSGGVCVLLHSPAPAGSPSSVAMGCSDPEHLARGASVELLDAPGMAGKVIAAGVVPDGVAEVRWRMSDGSAYGAPVHGNTWARVTDQAAASGEEATLIEEG